MSGDDMLDSYADDCRQIAASYIERATRFGASDLRIREASPTLRPMSVTIRHDLEVRSMSHDVRGVPQSNPDDHAIADLAEYERSVAAQLRAEVSRVATMDELVKLIEAREYGAVSERTLVRTHPSRLLYTYACNGCRGAGRVRCNSCNGQGEVACTRCSGTGQIPCFTCNGSGTQVEVRQERVPYSTQVNTIRRTVSCPHCWGGTINCVRTVQCGTCNGSGSLTCDQCSGQGRLRRITTTTTYTAPRVSASYPTGTPDYVHPALCKAGLYNLNQVGRMELADTRTLANGHTAEFVYHGAIVFCDLSLDISGHSSSWILYGVPPRIFDARGILEVLLQSDFDKLGTVVEGTRRLAPWFPRLARTAVSPFMRSEIHQQIVDADTGDGRSADRTPAVITELVNRAVSEPYVAQSLARLGQVVQAALIWWHIRWACGVGLFSLLSILLLTAVFDGGTSFTVSPGADRFWLLPRGDVAVASLVSVPVAFLGGLVGRWTSRWWLRRAGGNGLLKWAARKTRLVGWGMVVPTGLVSVLAVTGFYNTYGLWVDMKGRAYGVLPIVQPLHVAQPPRPALGPAPAMPRHQPRPAPPTALAPHKSAPAPRTFAPPPPAWASVVVTPNPTPKPNERRKNTVSVTLSWAPVAAATEGYYVTLRACNQLGIVSGSTKTLDCICGVYDNNDASVKSVGPGGASAPIYFITRKLGNHAIWIPCEGQPDVWATKNPVVN